MKYSMKHTLCGHHCKKRAIPCIIEKERTYDLKRPSAYTLGQVATTCRRISGQPMIKVVRNKEVTTLILAGVGRLLLFSIGNKSDDCDDHCKHRGKKYPKLKEHRHCFICHHGLTPFLQGVVTAHPLI